MLGCCFVARTLGAVARSLGIVARVSGKVHIVAATTDQQSTLISHDCYHQQALRWRDQLLSVCILAFNVFALAGSNRCPCQFLRDCLCQTRFHRKFRSESRSSPWLPGLLPSGSPPNIDCSTSSGNSCKTSNKNNH